jgi:hypothetical protein
MSPDPNWYIDPSEPSQGRYWDGANWTEHVTDIPAGGALPLFPAPPPAATLPPPPTPSSPAMAESVPAQISTGPRDDTGRRRFVVVGVGALVVVAAVVIALVVHQSGTDDPAGRAGVTRNYTSISQILTTLSQDAGCTNPQQSGSAASCNMSGSDVVIVLVDSGNSATEVQQSEAMPCGQSNGQVYFIYAGAWLVSTQSSSVADKIHGVLGGSLKQVC